MILFFSVFARTLKHSCLYPLLCFFQPWPITMSKQKETSSVWLRYSSGFSTNWKILLHRTCFSLKLKLLKTEETHTHIHTNHLPIYKNWKHFYVYYLTLSSQHPFEVIKMQILRSLGGFQNKVKLWLTYWKKNKPKVLKLFTYHRVSKSKSWPRVIESNAQVNECRNYGQGDCCLGSGEKICNKALARLEWFSHPTRGVSEIHPECNSFIFSRSSFCPCPCQTPLPLKTTFQPLDHWTRVFKSINQLNTAVGIWGPDVTVAPKEGMSVNNWVSGTWPSGCPEGKQK